ncbi:MAG: molybdopterin-synthase adenylyltransferase MoeB [Pseudomonadota bacterium]
MIVVFVMAAVLWGTGAAMGTPKQARLIMIGLLYIGVLAIHVILPQGHPLREGLGSSPALWLLIGALAVLVLVYRQGLMWIRARSNPVAFDPPARKETFADVELERAARHIVLREIGGAGQRRLKESKVLVIGAGGLGSPALMYLGAAGIGTLGIIDDDLVENTNLQRQIIHTDDRIGMPKVFSAELALKAQNPFLSVKTYNRKLDVDIAETLFAEYDLVLDGTDGFDTRALSNRAAVATGTPLVWAAISQWDGQIGVYDPSVEGPCYACVYPEPPADGLSNTCVEAGVAGPLPGVIGSMMAVEAIKLLVGTGSTLSGSMLIYDGLYADTRKITFARRADCKVCKV